VIRIDTGRQPECGPRQAAGMVCGAVPESPAAKRTDADRERVRCCRGSGYVQRATGSALKASTMTATARSRSAGATAITARGRSWFHKAVSFEVAAQTAANQSRSSRHRGHSEPPFRCNEPERRIAEDRVANGLSLASLQRYCGAYAVRARRTLSGEPGSFNR